MIVAVVVVGGVGRGMSPFISGIGCRIGLEEKRVPIDSNADSDFTSRTTPVAGIGAGGNGTANTRSSNISANSSFSGNSIPSTFGTSFNGSSST